MAIPVANEEDSIVEFVGRLAEVLARLPYECRAYFVVDDFSRDRTEALLRELEKRHGFVRTVFFRASTGVASCYLEGFRQALADGCDFIIEMDSGGSHPPEKIAEILEALDGEGYDVVFMSRFLPGGRLEGLPWYRTWISRGGTWLANRWLRLSLSDATSGFEGFRRHVLEAMVLDAFLSQGGIYQTEMKYYCSRYRYKEIPFHYRGSTSSFRFKWLWIALKTLFRMKANTARVFRPTAG